MPELNYECIRFIVCSVLVVGILSVIVLSLRLGELREVAIYVLVIWGLFLLD